MLLRRIKSVHPNLYAFLGHLRNVTVDSTLELARLNNGLRIRRVKKKSYLLNDQRIASCQARFASGDLTRINFLRAVSHTLRQAVHDDTDIEEDEHAVESDSNNETSNYAVTEVSTDSTDNSSANSVTGAQVPESDAVSLDLCEVCLLQQRSRAAFVPCGHSRLCENCVSQITQSGSVCPICRATILMTINIY